ncbi:MAG: ATP-binding cassette domain-containing protein [[Ruminococcus] torques]|uniref:ATP-binding cassette domain-containing protein n=1 Tax=[Ruminococcus] torques TaxID=33039 RepID=UPI003992AA02
MKQQYISIRHLSKKFNKDFVLKDINAVLNSNEILGFLGPSGAGKTTTIKILTGQLKPTSGNAEILALNAIKSTNGFMSRLVLSPIPAAFTSE